MKMNKIESFKVDHTVLKEGMYISRKDGDITTYDIRMKKPNKGDYLDYKSIHTIEHLFATYARNTKYSDNIVYVGPMGCRTGFYFLTRGISDETSLEIVKESMKFIASYEGEIPGASEKECGNYLEHNLEQAKKDAKEISDILKNWNYTKMNY